MAVGEQYPPVGDTVCPLLSSPPPSPLSDCRCQRKKAPLGKGLGKTTGWIHRTSLKKHGTDKHKP